MFFSQKFFKVSYPIDYVADPLDRKGKQKRAPSTTLLEHDHILPACSNIFNATCVLNRNEVDAYREERKKLKKVHKEREREEERKHRKKYKCFDDNCKHNHKKHKKRRKHKKHHHLAKEEERSSPLADGHISPDDSVSQIGTFSQVPINGVAETKVRDSATKDDTEEDNGSTVTESSGSLYVSDKHLPNIHFMKILTFLFQHNSNRSFLKTFVSLLRKHCLNQVKSLHFSPHVSYGRGLEKVSNGQLDV